MVRPSSEPVRNPQRRGLRIHFVLITEVGDEAVASAVCQIRLHIPCSEAGVAVLATQNPILRKS